MMTCLIDPCLNRDKESFTCKMSLGQYLNCQRIIRKFQLEDKLIEELKERSP